MNKLRSWLLAMCFVFGMACSNESKKPEQTRSAGKVIETTEKISKGQSSIQSEYGGYRQNQQTNNIQYSEQHHPEQTPQPSSHEHSNLPPLKQNPDSIDWTHWSWYDFERRDAARWIIFDDIDKDIAIRFNKISFFDTLIDEQYWTKPKFLLADISVRALKGNVEFDFYRDFKLGSEKRKITPYYPEWAGAIYEHFNSGKLKSNIRQDAPYHLEKRPGYPSPFDIATVGAAAVTQSRRILPFQVGVEIGIGVGEPWYEYRPEFIGPVYFYYGRSGWPVGNLDWEKRMYKR